MVTPWEIKSCMLTTFVFYGNSFARDTFISSLSTPEINISKKNSLPLLWQRSPFRQPPPPQLAPPPVLAVQGVRRADSRQMVVPSGPPPPCGGAAKSCTCRENSIPRYWIHWRGLLTRYVQNIKGTSTPHIFLLKFFNWHLDTMSTVDWNFFCYEKIVTDIQMHNAKLAGECWWPGMHKEKNSLNT